MPDWRQVLVRTATDIEDEFDRLRYRLHSALGGPDPIKVVPYRGFGNARKVVLHGRVIEDKGDLAARDHDSVWRNLLNAYRRFESDEIPHARVRTHFFGQEIEVQANEEGYFDVSFHGPPQVPSAGQMWFPLEIELLSPLSSRQPETARAVGEILIPPSTARFAVVSDIDDTVIDLRTTHLWRLARSIFLGNARTRVVFPGVAAFFRALHLGSDGRSRNPLFFLSSGPWNLYDLLIELFHLRGIPPPVLFLGDWGIGKGAFLPFQVREHKLAALELLAAFYPDLPFVLIGDSTHKDPEIYGEFARNHPGQALAILIRMVDPGSGRMETLRAMTKEMDALGIPTLLSDSTLAMAEWAASHGWIAPVHLPSIRDDKRADEQEKNPEESGSVEESNRLENSEEQR